MQVYGVTAKGLVCAPLQVHQLLYVQDTSPHVFSITDIYTTHQNFSFFLSFIFLPLKSLLIPDQHTNPITPSYSLPPPHPL